MHNNQSGKSYDVLNYNDEAKEAENGIVQNQIQKAHIHFIIETAERQKKEIDEVI